MAERKRKQLRQPAWRYEEKQNVSGRRKIDKRESNYWVGNTFCFFESKHRVFSINVFTLHKGILYLKTQISQLIPTFPNKMFP